MKKTIIALMALAGVAFATPAEDVTNAILTSGYQAVDSFTLTFTSVFNYEHLFLLSII